MLKPGETLLNGQYRILRQLGRRGFGYVHHARHTHLREEVAIKELIPGLVGEEQVLRRFIDEARATLRLRHERIVGTQDLVQERDNYYIIMEYMPGGSLEDRLKSEGPLPQPEALRVAGDVCQGLDHAHRQGIVHCDLKPANILFAADGTAKVADFGIAHVPEQALTRSWHTPAGFVAGTLPYMSPEPTKKPQPTKTPTPAGPSPGDTSRRAKDGMTMVYVPDGQFQMGSDDAQVDYALALCNQYPSSTNNDPPTPSRWTAFG